MSDTLDRLEALKDSAEYKAGYRGTPSRYQWTQISYDDLEVLSSAISGLRITVSCSDLRGLDNAISKARAEEVKAQAKAQEAELLERLRFMQQPPASVPAPAAPSADQLAAMIKMAVEAALAVKAPAQPES